MKVFIQVLIFILNGLLYSQGIEKVDDLLLKGITARGNKDYVTSLELLTEVLTIAEDNHWYKQQFLALNNIGANYYSMLDYGEALDHYLEAYTVALKHLNKNEEMTVLNNIAILYSKEGEIKKAKTYFYKAYVLSQEYNDTIKTGLYAVNLGLVSNELNTLDEALKYLKEAQKHLKGHSNLILSVDMALAENHYKRGDLNTSESLAKTLLPNLSFIEFNEERVSTLVLLSNISMQKNNSITAITYAEEARNVAISSDVKISAYKQLAKLYKAQRLIDAALESKDSIIALNKKLTNIKNGRFFEANKVKFEIANYRQELQLNRAKQISERIRFYTLLVFLSLIIMLISWALRNSFIKNKQRKILHKRRNEIIELELQKKKTDNLLLERRLQAKETASQLEQEKLKNEIETRNRKLAAKALQVSSRNELLKEVIISLSNQVEISKNAFLSKKIKELKSLLKKDSEWESFLKHFEEVNQNFISELKRRHPELNTNDIRYISYLYMDLTNKEISSLFNITTVASRKRKERISQKIGLSESSGLYSYLSGF